MRSIVVRWCVLALVVAGLSSHLAHAATTVAKSPNEESTQRLIVKFRSDVVAPARAGLARADRIALLATETGVALTSVRAMALGAELLALDAPVSPAQAQEIAARLAAHPDVLYAQADRRMRPLAIPNDPQIPNQAWYLQPSAAGINAYGAWDITVGATSTIVAVLDSGYRPHADLADRILPGYDFIEDVDVANDGNGRDPDASDPGDWTTQADLRGAFAGMDCSVMNSTWHGTGVASIIAADTDNGAGIAGLNWRAKILPLRVLGKCGGSTSDIVDAIAWAGGLAVPGVPANPFPAQIINLSLGGPGACDPAEQSTINAVLAKGITRAVVVAAGNFAGNVSFSDPANCVGVIAVAATSNVGNRASYSNFGAGVTISAPGGESRASGSALVVLGNTGTTVPGADAVFLQEAGTSVAAPVVSGVISLMLAVAPGMTAAQVRSALIASAQPFPTGSTCTTAICGAGIVNALGAVRVAQANIGTGAVNYQGLWWATGGVESGWGINFAHQGDVIFATWFTYDAAGNAWWLSMTANKVAEGIYTGTLFQTHGPPFNAVPFDPALVTHVPVGAASLAFTSASTATFTYTVNGVTQTKAIVPQVFGPVPTCVWGAQSNLSAATNYQDLWWATPAGVESGWGVNLTQQGSTIFATWFTYDVNGNPLWYSATLPTVASKTFSGLLYRNTGPAFSAVPFSPAAVHGTPVGTATVSFNDGNAGTFSYQVNDGANVASQSKPITRQVFRPPGTVCQ